LFGKTIAGEDFFKRLDDLRKHANSLQIADTLEVYLLCLLLGYQGRYGRIAPGELRNVSEELLARIEAIRGHDERLSPGTTLPASSRLRLQRRTQLLYDCVGCFCCSPPVWLFSGSFAKYISDGITEELLQMLELR